MMLHQIFLLCLCGQLKESSWEFDISFSKCLPSSCRHSVVLIVWIVSQFACHSPFSLVLSLTIFNIFFFFFCLSLNVFYRFKVVSLHPKTGFVFVFLFLMACIYSVFTVNLITQISIQSVTHKFKLLLRQEQTQL